MDAVPASRTHHESLRFGATAGGQTSALVETALVTPVSPVEAPVEETRSIEETLPPYRVVLHNDDVNSMDHVVRALVESVPELTVERAVEVMLEAHLRDRAEVIVCPLERAELYRDRLASFQLTATVERV